MNGAASKSMPGALGFGGVALVLLLLPVLGVQPASSGPDSRPNLVLITIDTLRADYLGSYGGRRVKTPTLDGLAADGVLFENAYCQVPLTPPSHASILTGTYPATHGLRDFTSGPLGPDLPTLATLLEAEGYRTAAFVSAFVLDRSWGLGRGFQLYFDEFDASAAAGGQQAAVERPANETLDRALPWLENAQTPFFLWLHLFDPHHDYEPPEPFRSLYREDPYAGEVAWVDSQLARLVGVLRSRGLYGDTLVVATSDHGEGLGEHGEREHGFFLYEEAIRIPLIFKLPARFGSAGRRVEEVVQSIDVLPSALQVLGLPSPASAEGRGQLSAMLGKRQPPGFAYAETRYPWTTFGWSPLYALREGDYKLIEAPRPELYRLAGDPGEKENRFSRESALAGRLRNRLERLQDRFRASGPGATPETDPETLERLGALGYVATGRAVEADGPLADPKDKLGVFERVLAGLAAAESGRLQRSNQIFREVVRDEPRLFIAFFSLGKNYLKLGRYGGALEAFEKARELNPGYVQIDLNAAQALTAQGDLAGAARLLEPLARAAEAPLRALQQLAVLEQRQGRLGEASALWRRVLERRPGDVQALEGLGVALVEQREFAEALGVLDRALESSPRPALVENFRGIALANLGRAGEAVEAYRRALAANPRYAQPRLNLSLTLLQLGRSEEARREFDQLCRLDASLCGRFRERFQ